MNKAFEDFVASRLTRYLAGQLHRAHPAARAARHRRSTSRSGPTSSSSADRAAAAYVADTKYKITDDGYGREADYYQILAYTSALKVPEGMLIYCHHDGSALPRQVNVRNLGTQLSTWALRFDRTPSHIEHELHQSLAAHITEHAATAQISTPAFSSRPADPPYGGVNPDRSALNRVPVQALAGAAAPPSPGLRSRARAITWLTITSIPGLMRQVVFSPARRCTDRGAPQAGGTAVTVSDDLTRECYRLLVDSGLHVQTVRHGTRISTPTC